MLCKQCNNMIEDRELQTNNWICSYCGKYFPVSAKKRIEMIADSNSFKEWNTSIKEKNIVPTNNRIEAVITGEIRIDGIRVAIGVMDTSYMYASMGFVVGEKITRLFEKANRLKLPVILFCCSGGARIQEGIISLMQMEKTVSAIKRFRQAGNFYVSVLTNPTMGGVAASFATAADIIIAEKNATIGFAGSRVIEQNLGEKLPSGYQTAEFLLMHGFVDGVLPRLEIKYYLKELIRYHKKCTRINLYNLKNTTNKVDNVIKNNDVLQLIQNVRSKNRPTSLDYIEKVFDSFLELHGDRVLEDDHAIVGGLAFIYGMAVTVIGSQKGKKNIEEAKYRNWGMASPSGYRKALRLAKQAEKFKRPIIFFVDTIGAACGIEAEKNGQIYSISDMLMEMADIRVPVLSIIHGEAGSGGALALAVANEVWIFEKAIYEVITPEGYASILWKNNNRANEASRKMKITSKDLLEINVIDRIIEEPDVWDTATMNSLCEDLKSRIFKFIKKYQGVSGKKIAKMRYKRFRRY